MDRVDLKLGFYCNNLCRFCVQGKKRKKEPGKSRAEAKKALSESHKNGKREVVFTGGEPTLHPDFLHLVRFARSLGYKIIQIQSNGRTFAYPEFCRKMVRAGANQFAPSIHGHTPRIHDDLTCVKGSFAQTTKGIENLKKMGQYVLTNTVITSSNYKHLPDMAKMLIALDVRQTQFSFPHILGSAHKNRKDLVPRKTDVMPYVHKAIEICKKAGRIATTEAIPYCFMQGYEDCISEQYVPETFVYDAGFTVEDFLKYRREDAKVKGPECPKCKYFKKCEGPWKEYPQIYGWNEFVPVK